jgi:gluconate 5-dehydrogenase
MHMALGDLFDLRGQVALVTGGGRGIGKTIAEALAESGARVAITGRRSEYLDPTTAEFQGRGFDVLSVVADVTKSEDVERAVTTTLERFGQIDILVNNAGQTWGQATEEMPFDRWQQVIEVNLNGLFLMSQRVGQHMLARGSGHILNVASVAGLSAGDPQATKTIAYNASKSGVISFTKTLAREWGPRGVYVNAIAPGWFPTRMASAMIERHRERFEAMTALGRIGELDDLKAPAVFLCSPASRYITGHVLVVDGGASL